MVAHEIFKQQAKIFKQFRMRFLKYSAGHEMCICGCFKQPLPTNKTTSKTPKKNAHPKRLINGITRCVCRNYLFGRNDWVRLDFWGPRSLKIVEHLVCYVWVVVFCRRQGYWWRWRWVVAMMRAKVVSKPPKTPPSWGVAEVVVAEVVVAELGWEHGVSICISVYTYIFTYFFFIKNKLTKMETKFYRIFFKKKFKIFKIYVCRRI